MKTCVRCKVKKKINEFYKSRKALDGHSSWCKPCFEFSHTRWKNNNMEKYKELQVKAQRRYRSRNPEKTKAHSISHRKKNELIKSSCEVCGSGHKLNMHHPDYSRPSWVITLCTHCHWNRHHQIT